MRISVVSPVYKAENIVDELIKRIIDSVSVITNDFEIILVDDFSPDNSWEMIQKNCKRDNRIKGIKLSRNFGQHYAITCGLDYSKGDYVVVIDCDLQDDPEFIPRMYEEAIKGNDIVFTRIGKRTHSFIRNLSSKLFLFIFNWLSNNNSFHDNITCFSMLSRKAVNAFCRVNDAHRHYLMVLRWLGFKHTFVEVEQKSRYAGESSYSYLKLFNHALDGIVSQSDKLLRLSVALGFAFSTFSILMMIAIIVSYFLIGFKEGWTSIIAAILLSCGLILISIGILGIYIGKTFEQVKNRPLYLVDELMNVKQKKEELEVIKT